MADQTVAAGSSQAEPPPAPQAGTNDTQTHGQEPQVFDAEYVSKLRTEAASYRTRLANAEKSLKAIEDEKLSSSEKLQKQLDVVMAERDSLAKEARQARVMGAAAKANALYPDAVARLIPDDATDFDSAVKDIRKSYPAMFRTSTADGGAGNGSEQPTNMNQLIRARMAGG